MRGGGAEKVTLLLANEFVRKGQNVDLILLKAEGEFLTELDSRINVINLNTTQLLTALVKLIGYLQFTRPDVLLVLMWPLTIIGIIAYKLAKLNGKVITSEHTTFSKSPLYNSKFKSLIFKISLKLIYPLADNRLAVSNGVADDIAREGWLNRNSIKVIFNPVELNPTTFTHNESQEAWKEYSGKKIVAVGSLKVEKDYPNLLKAFAMLLQQQDAHLSLVGQGKLLTSLKKITQELNIENNVSFIGFSRKASAWIESADLFVLSSLQEGLPMVLIEALAVGTPIVSTDCESGPREILEDGKYGILVPVNDPKALAEAMLKSLNESHDKDYLRQRASAFSVDKIANQYLEIFE